MSIPVESSADKDKVNGMCFKYGQIENQRGAVAPLMAVLLVVLLLALAIVVDLGHIHNAKIELQQAVDASALAGAGQLNGQSGADARATNTAEQTLIANDIISRAVDLASENVAITIGHWNTENLGASFEDRWAPGVEPFNAVRVQAEIEVEHTFFSIVAPSTTVPVDALAVQQRSELTLPLVVISCIPPTGPEAGELDACGIQTYSFASNENTAGWSSLTLGGSGGSSQQEIADLFDGDGSAQFNRIVELLETSSVVSRDPPWNEVFEGCEGNEGETGNPFCGLGGDFGSYTTAGDPVTRYTELPRFITLSTDEQDAFADIISQDGILFKQSTETDAQFQTRLANLYSGAVNPYGDNRFLGTGPEGEQLIRYVNDKFDFNENGVTNEKVYIPDFNRAVDYAGYPPVSATTGAMSVVMGTLLDKITPPFKQKKDIQFTDALTKENPPFDEDGAAVAGAQGETLLFTIPVIFAGSCGGFDPKSFDNNTAQESGELHYVGLANFLVTRIWKGGDCYETSDPVLLNATNSLDCDPTDHEPELLNGTTYACPVSGAAPIAFEGLIRPPGLGEESGGGTRVVVYLVE
ncbi:MAG: hypothetical protein C0615_05365 [Desulfuromonas sp.]|nr:MAG: hypothetical protein C0615_05365 [Desulfuromonas sp.]